MEADPRRWDQAMRHLRAHLFERDIEPWRGALLAYCRHLTGDLTAAEDLQQETLLRGFALCQICGGFDNAKAWLFRSAGNLWIDQCRRRRVEALPPSDLTPAALSQSSGVLGADWRDFLARMLSPREFDVIVLRDIHGYSGAETAQLLGMTEAAVKMAASRARRRLRVSILQS